MKTRKLILFICVLASMHVSGQQIAYVYTDSILLSLPRYAATVSKLDSMKLSYQKELEQNKVQLQERIDKLLKPYNKVDKESLPMLKMRMNPMDTLSLAVLIDENNLIQNKTKNYDNLLKSFYARDIRPMLDQVTRAISGYAIKANLTAIYSMEQLQSSLVYIDNRRNVTKAIIELLRKKK
jgi:Skp family chaperone for outer membrane proteins